LGSDVGQGSKSLSEMQDWRRHWPRARGGWRRHFKRTNALGAGTAMVRKA